MLSILERYIARTIASATGLVTLIITGVLLLMLALKEFKNAGVGDYTVIQSIFYIFLRLPNELYQFTPMLLLLGSVAGLSILSSNRELMVMRASGFSMNQIMRSVLLVAVLLVAIFSVLGEAIAPTLSYKAEIRKENAQNAGQAVVTSSGVWLHVGNNFIHIQHVVGRDSLEGVTRYQFDDKRHLLSAYYAKSLTQENHQWIMHDVAKTTFHRDRAISETIPKADWELKINSNLLNMGLIEPNDMSLPRLAAFVRYLEKNHLLASEYKFEFWQRMVQPLASLIMILLAIPIVLGLFSRSTLGWRMLMSIFVGLIFIILNSVLAQLCIVYQIPAAVAAILPLIIFAIAGVVMMQYVQSRV